MLMAGLAKKEYDERLPYLLAIDINLRNDNLTRVEDYTWNGQGRPYSNTLGGLNVGSYPES
jgi:hypothetical protein